MAQQAQALEPALAVTTLATLVSVHLWAVAQVVSLEDWPDLVLVTREVCLLALEVTDTAVWAPVLEAALLLLLEPVLVRRHQLVPVLEEEPCHLLELALELVV